MHIPIVEVVEIKADDLIGTLSKQAEKEGFQVFMVTPDKDYAQLVSENIFMYKPARMGNGIEIWGVNKEDFNNNPEKAKDQQLAEMIRDQLCEEEINKLGYIINDNWMVEVEDE